MQVLWLLDMKGIPIYYSKSRENFLTFCYRIFSTVVFKTKATRQKKSRKASYNADEAPYIMFANTDSDSEFWMSSECRF